MRSLPAGWRLIQRMSATAAARPTAAEIKLKRTALFRRKLLIGYCQKVGCAMRQATFFGSIDDVLSTCMSWIFHILYISHDEVSKKRFHEWAGRSGS